MRLWLSFVSAVLVLGSGCGSSPSPAGPPQPPSFNPAMDVLTHRNDNGRQAVQANETILTPANVNAANFGKLATFNTDGYVYAQPLFVSGYTMSDGLPHNVLFVVASTGTVYAFDTDNRNSTLGYLWETSVIPPGELAVNQSDINCTDTQAEVTVIGTPVIDRTLGVLYLVSKTKAVVGTTTTYYQRIHALNLADGTEKLNGPTLIQASVPGTGAGSAGGMVAFDPLRQNQRAGLVEADNSVWIAWASHCDYGKYHGWVMGYNASNLQQQTGVFNDSPDGWGGGIWMAGGGISADSQGNLYVAAGNGDFNANSGGPNVSESALKLQVSNSGLTLADWFSPYNESSLSYQDLDLGTSDVMLFDDPMSGVAPHLAITADKTGRVYLMNAADLGGFQTGASNSNGDLQDWSYGPQLFRSYAYFNGKVYIGEGGEPLQMYLFTPGSAQTAGYLATAAASETSETFSETYSRGGIAPVISADGIANGIVWGIDVTNSVLYAFDAGNLQNLLYSSTTNAARDQVPGTVKFTAPVIANGKVFIPGQSAVAVYGLLQ